MKYITITNWDKFQHYKDRRPTWIKLLIDIIDEFDEDGFPKEFYKLPDTAKLTFVMLLCLRPNYNRFIPYPDTKWLRKRLGINSVNLQPLIAAGFIVIDTGLVQDDTVLVQDDTEQLQTCTNSLSPERERETERETETEGEQNVQETFLLFWNSQKDLPKIQSMSNARTKLLKTRMKNTVFMKEWKTSVVRLAASDFHTGNNDRQWKATVDWFLKNDTNWVKALELPDPQPPKPSRRKQEEMQQREKAREGYTEYLTRATPEQVDMFRDRFPQHHWLVDELKGKDRRGDD